MAYTLELIATGMVTFRPAAVVFPSKLPDLTFVMIDNPSRRRSINYPEYHIEKHVAFVLAPDDSIVSSSSFRPRDLSKNKFAYGGWILDKERLSLSPDPKTALSFDSSIRQIANIAWIDSVPPMDPAFATIRPPDLGPVAAQLFIESGAVWAEGKPRTVQFKAAGGTAGPTVVIRNEVHIQIDLPERLFSLRSVALDTGAGLTEMRLQFVTGQTRMQVYFGSAPPSTLQEIPSGSSQIQHIQDIDFELYYDITRGGPPPRRPIPHPQGGSGPVPGSERCPPLQNA